MEPKRDYEPLPDNIFTLIENDIPISLPEEDVFVFLNNVKPGKSGGPDCFPNWVLRKFAAILAKPVSTIINASFKENQVPACWKLADICPIQKCKQVTDINKDLRPISLSSTLCKIAEDAITKYDCKELTNLLSYERLLAGIELTRNSGEHMLLL